MPPIGQIEAAILLDVVERLTLHLKALDVTEQRWLMKRKFELLALRDHTSMEDRLTAARALHEDLIETELKAGNTAPMPSTSTDQSAVPSTSSTVNQNAACDVVLKVEEGSRVERRGRGRKKLSGGEGDCPTKQVLSTQQKKPLYGLNPFSIPIKYLNPKIKPKMKHDCIGLPGTTTTTGLTNGKK
jgi:hypothetical protein